MLRGFLTGVMAGVAVATQTLLAPAAWADPTPEPDPGPPPPPNVNVLTPASPVDFAIGPGVWAFAGPGGLTCLMNLPGRTYGCNGPMPGAPNGANVVTGGATGEPGFASTDKPIYAFDKPVKELAAGTRLSASTVSCGVIGESTICTNSFDQTGFVIAPTGSFTFGAVNPMLDRPKGTNPYMN